MKHLQFIAAVCVLSVAAGVAHAGMVKWVDENGQVHYGDRIPPQYLNQKHETLNEQGVVIERTKAAKTDEELAKEEAERKAKAEQDRERLIQQRKEALRDRVLLETFTKEEDLIHARDDRVEAVDTQILLTETIIKDSEKKLQSLKARIEGIEKSGRQVPENLRKEQAAVSEQLQTHYQYVESKNDEKQQIISKFDEDIKRFRELMEMKKQRQAGK